MADVHRQNYQPKRAIGRRAERVLGVLVAIGTGLALAELLARWAMSWGIAS